MAREQFIDPDFRREPKTDRWCARCQKDIPGKPAGWIYLRADGATAVHPDDVNSTRRPDDLGWFAIGSECTRKLRGFVSAEKPN